MSLLLFRSRNILISPHCNPSDTSCADVLTTVYQTLLYSTLRSWSPKDTLTADSFVAFVQSVLDGLPSSSTTSTASSNAAIFGEIIVDLIWTVDVELEEIQSDAKATLVNAEHGAESGKKLRCPKNYTRGSSRLFVNIAIKSKQNAEQDKETLAYIVKKFLVRATNSIDHP